MSREGEAKLRGKVYNGWGESYKGEISGWS